ncbi:unnamed protein product [marine sediment metagenome]|uniref:Uncharacterized protein n=1 Tax=marine sediment metagenome TaxID=412755 RepID=X1JGC1_9ZZZZ
MEFLPGSVDEELEGRSLATSWNAKLIGWSNSISKGGETLQILQGPQDGNGISVIDESNATVDLDANATETENLQFVTGGATTMAELQVGGNTYKLDGIEAGEAVSTTTPRSAIKQIYGISGSSSIGHGMLNLEF